MPYSYSLHPSPPFRNKEEWMGTVRERKGMTCFAVFEGEGPVSIAVSTPYDGDVASYTPHLGFGECPQHLQHGGRAIAGMQWQGYFLQIGNRKKHFQISIDFRSRFTKGWVMFLFLSRRLPGVQSSLAPLLKMDLNGEF